MLLVAIFLSVNLVTLYYLLYLNTVFGFVAYLYTHAARFGSEGSACANVQENRALILLIEVIVFWVTFVVLSFPQLFLLCMKRENVEKAFIGKSEEEDNEGEEKKEAD